MHTPRRSIAVLVVVGACGRAGFDVTADADIDALQPHGAMDELAIWSSALGDADVRAICANQRP